MNHIDDGLHDSMSNHDYHACEAFSRSQLMWLLKSDNYFLYRLNKTESKAQSEQMQLGTLVHLMLLEADSVDGLVVIAPEFNRRTKLGKEEEALFLSANEGKIVVTPHQFNQAQTMSDKLYNRINEELPSFFAHSKNEHSIIWTYDGIRYKCRPDAFVKSVVIDVKTARDASKRAFQRAAIDDGYFLQAAMMKKGLASVGIEMSNFAFACVENTEPYTTGFYIIDDDALEYGERLFSQLHERLKNVNKHLSELREGELNYQTAYIGTPAWAEYLIEE